MYLEIGYGWFCSIEKRSTFPLTQVYRVTINATRIHVYHVAINGTRIHVYHATINGNRTYPCAYDTYDKIRACILGIYTSPLCCLCLCIFFFAFPFRFFFRFASSSSFSFLVQHIPGTLVPGIYIYCFPGVLGSGISMIWLLSLFSTPRVACEPAICENLRFLLCVSCLA